MTEHAPLRDSGRGELAAECATDQHGRRYALVTVGAGSVAVPRRLFVGPLSKALEFLAERGIEIINPEEKRRLWRLVAQRSEVTRSLLVADRPGWIATAAYALPDGTFIVAGGVRTADLICNFRADAAHAEQRDLQAWKALYGPLLKRQTLLQGVLCFALQAPLIRLFGAEVGVRDNPLLVLVGPTSCGKTTALRVVGSLLGIGTMGTWATTTNGLELMAQRSADGVLLLDEVLVAGAGPRARTELLSFATMSLASGRGKVRMGQEEMAPARFVLLSSANAITTTNAKNAAANDPALGVRMSVIDLVGREFGILDHAPDGGASALIDALNASAETCGGAPMRAFIMRLTRELSVNPEELRNKVISAARRFEAEARKRGPLPPEVSRILGRFALAFAAGLLARDWGILPADWEKPGIGTFRLFRMASESLRAGAQQDAVARLELALGKARHRFAEVGADATPGGGEPVGWLRRTPSGVLELVLRRKQFDSLFGTIADDLLPQLRACGGLTVEGPDAAGKVHHAVHRKLTPDGRSERAIALRLNPAAYPEKLEVRRKS
ncbi:DUF927 domain-containing protein [Falsiroseomonas sp. CW058]|uniref:DUF927 domain-containing protein n=1 Tax=Falsiroseomonas sp. CW058 TaxID=3388664 RepID=UPI003D318E1D